MQRTKPVTNEIYHIYNRGVEQRRVFLDRDDYMRFIHDLFEFNDENPAINLSHFLNQKSKCKEVGLPNIEREPRKLLVNLLAFCLMPNHFHLMVEQKRDNGITEFMRKLGTGYTNYFNQKYERSGHLFQGKYKFVDLKKDAHFIYLPYYIHFNPLDLKFPEWREGKIKNCIEAVKFLEDYKWSSFRDYIDKKNFPSVTQRDFLNHFFGGPNVHRKSVLKWIKEMDSARINQIGDLILE